MTEANRRRAVIPDPVCNDCPKGADIAAMQAQSEAMNRMATAIETASERVATAIEHVVPIATFLTGLDGKIDEAGKFARRWLKRIIWSAPIVLMAIGAITPEAGKALAAAIKALFGAG